MISGSTLGRYDDRHPEAGQEWVVRRIVLYELTSLDGVAEEPGNWMFEVDDAVVGNRRRSSPDRTRYCSAAGPTTTGPATG